MKPLLLAQATVESRAATLADLLEKDADWWQRAGYGARLTDDAKRLSRRARIGISQGEMYANETYTVHVRTMPPDGKHLFIKRNDRAPVSDWRDKQAIKNLNCAARSREGVELYPAESRVVDTANQFEIWCVPHQLPIGFPTGMKCNDTVGNSV